MSGTEIDVRTAAADEAPQALSSIGATFVSDPLARIAFRSPHESLRAMSERPDDLLGTFEQMETWLPEEAHGYLLRIGVEPSALRRAR